MDVSRIFFPVASIALAIFCHAQPPMPEANPDLTIRSDSAAPAWPEGEVHGLHTRGGAVVNMKWTPDRVEARIEATRDGKFQIRCRDQIKQLDLKAGQSVTLEFP
jgi:hypothetical protein